MSNDFICGTDARVLVTGSSGFIGVAVVQILLERGILNLRCCVRPSSRRQRLQEVLQKHQAQGEVEIVTGDLLSRADCLHAAAGVAVVYHLAAGFDKSFAGAFMNSALTTRNLVE